MPRLNQERRTKRINSVIEGGWIDVYTSYQMGDLEDVQKEGGNRMVSTIMKAIKGWNFEDEEGNILPVNEGNVKCLDAEDVMSINKVMEEDTFFGKLVAEQKQKQPSA